MPQILHFKNKGFTLIELIVVMAIFLFIVVAAFTIFIYMIQNQKRILSDQRLLNQISYIEEYMSKALRMAGTEKSTDTCLTDYQGITNYTGAIYLLTRYNINQAQYGGIKFINQNDNNACWEFYLDHADPKDLTTPLVLWVSKNGITGALASTSLQIESIRFAINGPGSSCFGEDPCVAASNTKNPLIQPRVTIILRILSDASKNVSCVNDAVCPAGNKCENGVCKLLKIFQITVSRRNLNVAS